MRFQLLSRHFAPLSTFSLKQVFTGVLLIGLFLLPSSDAAALRKPRETPKEIDLKNQLEEYMKTIDGATFFKMNTTDNSKDNSNASLLNALKNNSVCPWTTEHDINNNRYPRILSKVSECKCDECQGVNDTTMGCKKIEANIPVLMKRGDVGETGLIGYEATSVKIPVACICAKIASSVL